MPLIDSITLTFTSNKQFVKRDTAYTISQCADIVILADDQLEDDENIQLSITEEDQDVFVNPNTATVIILDNDSKK